MNLSFISTIVTILALATPAFAEISTSNNDDRLAKLQTVFPEIDAVYKEYALENHIPSYAYGIILDGKLVSSGCGGFTDLEKKNPVTTHSMFRIASMTKSFVAMAILKLRDEGQLRLDDEISLYIPEIQMNLVTDDSPAVTIRDLLTHSSGLPYDDPWADRQLDATDDAFNALLKNGISFSTPTGTAYEYSSLAYALLGKIIKEVSGLSYQKYIADHIWQPIGMTEVTWNFTDIAPSQLVHGFSWTLDGWKEEELLSDGAFGSMGGMITSIESFSQYIALHQSAWPPRSDVESALIKRSSLREMHQPWRFVDLEPHFKNLEGRTSVHTYAYGYGLRWARDGQGRVFVGHSGGLPGFGSNWFFMPEYGLGVVFFANVTYAPTMKFNLAVLDKLVVSAQLSPRQLQPSTLLQEKHAALVALLPDWKNAEASGLFAENFFLDRSIDSLRKETQQIFAKAGRIISVGDLVAESQLKGHFIVKCETSDVRINFSLTPETLPLIQQFKMSLDNLHTKSSR